MMPTRIIRRVAQRAGYTSLGLTLCIGTAGLLAGCAAPGPKPLPRSVRKFSQPTVAVLDFENKAWFPLDWNIGDGVRDILVDELVKSGRFSVVTRADLGAILGELEIQKDDHFRKEGRLEHGKLKNVRYLVKGAVTDFTHVAGGGVRAIVPRVWGGAKGSYAIVAITLYVISVETGEIVASESLEGRAYAGGAEVAGVYRNVTLGGNAFYRTPLGRATKQVMGKALERIALHVASASWRPRIAKVDGEQRVVMISGGIDRALKEGSIWGVYEPGEKVLDPDTGDVLGREPPRKVALLKVMRVGAKLSEVQILEGAVAVGQFLQPEK